MYTLHMYMGCMYMYTYMYRYMYMYLRIPNWQIQIQHIFIQWLQ